MNRIKRLPSGLRVDFRRNYHDAKLRLLRKRNFSYRAISRETGLSFGQISYRVKKGGLVVPRDYRDGLSPQAIIELERVNRTLHKMTLLRESIRKAFE